MVKSSKIYVRATTIFLILGMLVGCSSPYGKMVDNTTAPTTASNAAQSSTTALVEETKGPVITISQLVHDRGTIPSNEGTLEDNWFTQAVDKILLEKFNIKIKYVTVPNAQREQKLATLLAAGDAPDVCMTNDNVMLMNYSRNGGLVDLAPYMDEYAGNIKQYHSAEWIKNAQIDGKQTRLIMPSLFMADATWVRQDWLDKTGLKAPTSPDEFYNMLKAFKAQDPGKAGDRMLPFALAKNFSQIEVAMLQGFLKTPPTGEKLMTPWQLWPEAKDMLRFLNKLYNEELMGEFILDADTSKYKAAITTGVLGSTINTANYMGHSAYGNLEDTLQKTVPEAHFVPTYPWKDPACGDEYIYSMFVNSPVTTLQFFIPKTCEHPLEAFKYMDYKSSKDYAILAISGVEGADFKYVDGIPVPIDPAKFKDHVSWIGAQYAYLIQNAFVNDQTALKKVYASNFINKLSYNTFVNDCITGPLATKYADPIINADRPTFTKYRADLGVKWASAEAKMILGTEVDFDKNFADGLAQFKAEGGDAVAEENLKLYQTQYGN
ncbi:MAG TPA: hypothetical protein DEB10_05235 [Ruminococcaceae bacterium]|nr:hypothetical protein [Oscillospiraceae bacterium]